MKKNILFLIFFSLFLSLNLFSQNFIAWDSNESEVNFYKIQEKFNEYWGPKNIGHQTPKKEMGGWKAYKRWEWFWEQRTAPSGEFPPAGHLLQESKKWKARKDNGEKKQNINDWSNLGPFESEGGYAGLGRINWIEEDPGYNGTTNKIIWIGSPSGGLWKTTDDGESWSSKLDGFGSLGVSSIVIHPTNANIMYIATGDGDVADSYSVGILKSTNAGESWATTGLNWATTNNRTIRKIVMDPNNTNVLYAATSNGIYKTTDAGTNWAQVRASTRYFDIEFKPGSSDTLYASGFTEIVRTTNAGSAWSVLGGGIPTTGINRIELAVSPNQPNYVYALFGFSGSGNNNGFHSVYRSTDGGTNWTGMAIYSQGAPNLLGWESDGSDTGGQAWYDLVLAASPTDANTIFVGGVNCWKSTNGGTNWSISSHWWGDGVPAVHADHHHLAFSKNTSRLYNGNDGGIYRTTNNGTNWTWLGSGLPITQFYRFGTSKTNSSRIIAGAQDNGTKLLKSGQWYDAIGGDGMECIIDHTNADIMYGTLYYGALRKSTNAGVNWSSVTVSGSEQGGWVAPYVMHPTNSSIIFMGYKNLFKTTNGGTNWTALTTGWSTNLSVLHVATANPNYIYAGTSTTLKLSTDGGTNWNTITLPSSQALTYLATNENDPQKLYATFSGYSSGNKVFYSTNAGANWTNISGSLPNVPCNSIVYQRSLNNRIYVGTDIGVFWRDDNVSDWQDFNNNLPDVKVTELEIHYATSKMRIATYGRGIWESEITPSNEVDSPNLLSPENNSINFAFNNKLIWNKSTNATSYGLQISVNSDMSNPIYSKTGLTDTTFVVKDTLLAYNTNYYWRVNAKKDTITSGWSNVWKFKTQEYALTPTQLNPTNNITGVLNNTKIIWSKASTSQSYGLTVSPNSDMSNPIINKTGLTDTTYTISDTIFNYATTYYWRVNSKRDTVTSSWSTIWNFRLKANIIAATLTFPSNNATGIKLTDSLKWNSVTNATKYVVLVSENSNFTTLIANDTVTTNFSNLGKYLLKMNTSYYWKVLSMQNNDIGEWSSTFLFTTRSTNHIYCIPTTSSCDEYIGQVTFNTISKVSDCTDRYSDYSDYITGVTKGQTYSITVINPVPYSSDYAGVWFDWNQDGDFVDGGEYFALSTSNFYSFTGNITIPSTASKGKTMMRVRLVWNQSLAPCGTSSYGEVEDYSVYINPISLATPTLTSPTNNSTNTELGLNLGWSSITNATNYSIQVSTADNFSNLIYDVTNPTPGYTLSGLNYNTKYYWRVKANNADTSSNWSSTFNFKTKAQVVTLVSPANNALKQLKTTKLIWNNNPNVSKFQVQASNLNNFTTLHFSQFVTDTNYAGTWYNSTQYFWRVRAIYSSDTSAWSETRSLSIKDSLKLPVLATPVNNATNQKKNLVLDWNDVANAENYSLQVSTNSNFTTTIIDVWTANSTYSTNNLNYNTTYYWRVLAADFADTTTYSSTWNFTIKPNLTVPTLATPVNNATNQKKNLILDWNDVANAENYRLQVSTNSNFTTTIIDVWTVNSTYSPNNLNYNTQYYWRVLAADFADTTAYSGTWNFTIKPNLVAPTLASPVNNATNQKKNLVLDWNDVANAENYRLQVSTNSNFTTTIIDLWTANSTYSPTNLNYNTTYYWRVLAADFADTTAYSGTWNFTIKPNLTVPTLATPLNNATNQKKNLILDWNDVANAENYRLQVSTNSNFTTTIIDVWTANSTYSPNNLNYNTTYYWRVLAADFADTTAYSGTWNFTIKPNLTVPTLATPINNATNQKKNLVLDWNDVANAENYRLQVSTNSNFTSTIIDVWTANSTYSPNNLNYNTTYYWRVLAADFADTTVYSSTWNFTIKPNLTVPTLATPVNNATNQKKNLVLDWNDVANAENYRLQVSTNSNFTSTIIDVWTANSTYSPNNLNYNTTYYWRVLAADFADTTAYSSTWNFTIKPNLTVPTLATPVNNATNQKKNLVFDWNDVAIAENYHLQVSTNSNFTTTIIDVWTANSTYSPNNLNYNTTYYWRVLAADFADTTAYSGTWNFTTVAQMGVPNLVSVANNDEYVSFTPELNWTSVASAVNYRIQIARDVNFSTVVSDVSVALNKYSVESGKLSQLTNYYWRVNAFSDLDTGNWTPAWKFKTGNAVILNKYVATLVGAKSNSCNTTWTENEIEISTVLTNDADCSGAGNCSFSNLNDKIGLTNGKLKFNIEEINPFVDSVKIYIRNICGANCTNAFLQNGSTVINQASSTANGIITLTLKNNNSYVSDIYVSSCNAEILEIMIFGNGTYPKDIPEDWDFVSNTGKSSKINISKNIPNLINSRKLMVGDAIGAFFDDNGTMKCAGYIVWNGNNLELTVWGDDINTVEKDGFADNEQYKFKMWDSQDSKSINAKVKYLSGNNFFTNNTTSELSEIYGEDLVQTIILNQGWNINSSYIIPNNNAIPQVFNDIKDDIVIVKNSAGKIYLPSSNTNSIGTWNYKEAYQIYAKKQVPLKMFGVEAVPQNTDIILNRGWSLVPYLRKFENNINTQLSTIEQYNVLVIAKNSAGQVYIPNGVNTINNMRLGQGYQMYLSRLDTLVYPANYLSRSASNDIHENYDSRMLKVENTLTGNNASLILNVNLPNNTEIAVLNENNLLVGTGRVVDGKTAITIWGDDESTDEIDGATSNSDLKIMIYDIDSKAFNELNNLELTDIITGIKHYKLAYDKDAVWVGQEITKELKLSVSPNPFSYNTTVIYELNDNCDVELALYNNDGVKVLDLVNGMQNKGSHKLTINSQNLSSGSYNLILKSCGNSVSERIIIAK